MPKGRPAMSPAEKAAAFPTSAKLAIAAYCYHDCQGEVANNAHTTKLAIRDCRIQDCNLWSNRPWQTNTFGHIKPKPADAEQPEQQESKKSLE